MNGHASLAIALLMVSITWIAWAVDRRAAQQHLQRMADLAECARQLAMHEKALEAIVDHDFAPPMLKRLAAEVSATLADRSSIERLTHWIMTSDRNQTGDWSTEVGSLLGRLSVTDPTLAAEFRRCVESGFVAACLRWPETAAVWRSVSARFLAEPDRGSMVAMRLWRKRPDKSSETAAFAA